MKFVLKRISVFLVICLLNTICPLPALAADVTTTINNLTPQQKEEVKNLTPQQKDEIKKALGFDTPQPSASGTTKPVVKQAVDLEQTTLKDDETIVPGDQKEAAVAAELSAIEQGFTRQVGDQSTTLRQFGYNVFSKTVGQRFSSTAGIPLGVDYNINTGDQLVVTIWGNINDTYALEVDERGTVTLPKVGVIQLAGYSLAKAKDILTQRLAETYVADFNLDLTLKEIGSIKIYVIGEVANPGAYTIKSNNTLYDAIFMAGGPTRVGSLRNIKLLRNNQVIQAVDLYQFILHGKKPGDVIMKSGDVVQIPPIGETIAISGNVRRPAIYELKGKTDLNDFIVVLDGGITPTTYLQRLQIERKKDNRAETAIDIDYADYLKTKDSQPVYLSNLDYITVFSITSTIKNVVYLQGNVIRPGRYELESGMRLGDLLAKAQGLAPETYMQRAQIIRLVPPDMRPKIMAIDLSLLKAGEVENNPYLKEFDKIRIFSKTELEGSPTVYVNGEINDGDSSFPLTQGMHVSDLIFQAGGLKESAFHKAELIRNEKNQVVIYTLDLKRILTDKDKNEDLLLQKNDYLFVRIDPDYFSVNIVTLKGNVLYPGNYILHKGEHLSSVIDRAGGFTDKAFLEGAVFIREALKAKQLSEIEKVKKEFAENKRRELSEIPYGLPSGEAEFRAGSINREYDFALRKLEMDIPGRVVIQLGNLKTGSDQDIVLQAGDSLTIPNKEMGVIVLGEIYSPATILYEKGKTVNDYVNACGGETTFADFKETRVLRVSGKTEKINWTMAVKPGDTIFVPTKPLSLTRYQKPFDWNQFWGTAGDVAKTLASLTTSLVSVYLLYITANK